MLRTSAETSPDFTLAMALNPNCDRRGIGWFVNDNNKHNINDNGNMTNHYSVSTSPTTSLITSTVQCRNNIYIFFNEYYNFAVLYLTDHRK